MLLLFNILLEFFEDNHYMIICTTSEQLSEWIKCIHFQIDLSFKRVSGEINEFEVNHHQEFKRGVDLRNYTYVKSHAPHGGTRGV